MEAAEVAISVTIRPFSRASVAEVVDVLTSLLRRLMTSLGRFSAVVTPSKTSSMTTLEAWEVEGRGSVVAVANNNNSNRGAEIHSEALACLMTMMMTSSVEVVSEAASVDRACSDRCTRWVEWVVVWAEVAVFNRCRCFQAGRWEAAAVHRNPSPRRPTSRMESVSRGQRRPQLIGMETRLPRSLNRQTMAVVTRLRTSI